MKKRKVAEPLFTEINPILEEMGYVIVELNQLLAKGIVRVTMVLFRQGGFSMDDCVRVHKVIMPRLEVLNPEKEVYLDILSPGVGRTLKTVEELEIFKGSLAKFLIWNTDEWQEGLIGEIQEDSVVLFNQDQSEKTRIRINDIQKAKLF